VLAELVEGPVRRLAGFVSREGVPIRAHAVVVDETGRAVGEVTSGTFSPTLQRPIAMAYLSSEVAQVGQALDVDIRGSRATATIVDLPFYRRPQ